MTTPINPPMIALYRGLSPLSRAIRWWNWSDYSHAAWLCSDGSCTEAWAGRVQRAGAFDTLHTRGTAVDCYTIEGMTGERARAIRAFLAAQVGKRYDWRGILRFGFKTIIRADNQDRWFCSELVFAACQAAGIELLARTPAWKVYPGLLACSPLLRLRETRVCGEREPEGYIDCDELELRERAGRIAWGEAAAC